MDISEAIYKIEDYLGGNVIGFDDEEIDYVGLTARLRNILTELVENK